MIKLLDADWFRGIQLFHNLYGSTINDFPNENKQIPIFAKSPTTTGSTGCPKKNAPH